MTTTETIPTTTPVHISQRPPASSVRIGRGDRMVILSGRAAEVWEPEFRIFLNVAHYNLAATRPDLLSSELVKRATRDKVNHAGAIHYTWVVRDLATLEDAIVATCRAIRHEEEVAARHVERIADREYRAAQLGAPEMTLRRFRFDSQGNTASHLQKLGVYIAELEKERRRKRVA